MLDLHKLHYFVTVAEHENVGRAAAALNITQSPLSRQIQDLEQRLGMDLFFREKQRIRLTPAGRNFLSEAKELLEKATRVEQYARAIANGTDGILNIAYVEGALHCGVLTRHLKVFGAVAPKGEVLLNPMRSSAQFGALDTGRIDIGFAYRFPPQSLRLSSRLAFKESFKIAIPIASKVRYAASDLHGRPFIAPPVAGDITARQELLTACANAGFIPDIRHEAASPLSAMEMVSAGLGFAFVQESLARIRPKGVALIECPAGLDLAMSIYAVWKDECSSLARRFLDVFI